MTIQIPTSWNGVDGKEAYERIMKGKEEPEKESKIIPITKPNGKDTKDFIYIPSINLYVAKKRTHLGKDWFQCHKLLQANGERMLILPEFIEFLNYTKTNFSEIYKDITEVRDPWRAEWLDAKFNVKGNELYINYHHILDSNGNLIPKNSEILDRTTLMKDKTPGISLEDYLNNNHTTQGLPSKKVKSGDLCYWTPKNGSVAWFDANSVMAIMSCSGVPSDWNSNLGVRAVKINL